MCQSFNCIIPIVQPGPNWDYQTKQNISRFSSLELNLVAFERFNDGNVK